MSISIKRYKEHFRNLEKRFPGARFAVACFDINDGDDFDNKILCDNDYIICNDEYCENGNPDMIYNAFIMMQKKEGKNHIYLADVVDELIKRNYPMQTFDHKLLESIKIISDSGRMATCSLSWSS